jgi:segregation and condensation protein A
MPWGWGEIIMSDEFVPRPGVEVQLDKFQGPLDLLLHLIQRDEIDIRDIPIAHITQQFLHYLEMMRLLDLEISGEFLVMAATLMRIKARTLLPVEEPIEGEELDPREELVRRLLEYKQYKEVAGTLRDKEQKRSLVYERGQTPTDIDGGPLPLASVTLFDLLDALDRVLTKMPERNLLEMEAEAYDIEDKMALLAGMVRDTGRLSFGGMLAECRTRMEVIVTFLALLELLRMGRVTVAQDEPFGEIWLEVAAELPLPPGEAVATLPVAGARPETRKQEPAEPAGEDQSG